MTELQGHEDRLEISADSGCSSGRGQRARMVAPEWVVQRFSTRTLPESKVLPIAPMGSPPSAAHTTPWPRPRPSRGLWPEARWSESAVPWSRPCRTGTAAPELKHSDDRPHAPWFASATPGPSVYPQPQPSGIPADPFSRSPYHAWGGVICPMAHIPGHNRSQMLLLPEAVDDYVGPDNPVPFIEAFVDELDLEAAGFARALTEPLGRPDPTTLTPEPPRTLPLRATWHLCRVVSARGTRRGDVH